MYRKLRQATKEFIVFGILEAKASIFAALFFITLFLSTSIPLFGLPRYDFLFIAAVLIQVVLYALKLETWQEIKVIFLFHLIGLVLELYKTSAMVGSWSYPEFAYLKIGTVPLYSGFMYAAVGSYISQAWNYLGLKLTRMPSQWWCTLLCIAIYVNFFTNHFIQDLRYILIPLVFVTFWRTRVYFRPIEMYR